MSTYAKAPVLDGSNVAGALDVEGANDSKESRSKVKAEWKRMEIKMEKGGKRQQKKKMAADD